VANLNDAPVGAPTITGNLWAGQTLTVQTNGISDADSLGALSGFQYQWFADGDAIDSALASTLILTSDLVGKSISVETSYVDGGDTEETLRSAETGAIFGKETLGVVAVSGIARQGQLLQANLSDADGVATVVTWKWFANGAEISGQTGSTMQLSQAQVSKTITASASYTDGNGNLYATTGVGALAPVLSGATASVTNVNDRPTGAVTITGTASQGMPLTAVTSGLADADGLGVLSYQWKANGVNIAGATGSTFTPNLQSQVGQKMSVTVSYTDLFLTKESKTSASTALVIARPNEAPTGSIIVSGTPAVGSTLTASHTFVDPNGTVGAVTYTWSMSTTLGGASQSIGSGAALQFSAAHLNQHIRVTATYSDGIYTNTVVSGVLRLGTTGIDTMNGAGLADRLCGNDGADVLAGAGGNDTLYGGAGNDALTGGSGDDTFNVDFGSDSVTDLGNGNDVLIVAAGATATVTMAAAWTATAATTNNGTANIFTNGLLVNLAAATGSAGLNVTNTGTATTSGTTLTGSSTANTLTSGAGTDTLVGGAGNDTYVVNATSDLVTELTNGGTDLVSSSATYVLSANVENLTLTGATAINGTGNGFNNTIIGNSGANVLAGGLGSDTLTGGSGADKFLFNVMEVAANRDTIIDFSILDGDKIQLSKSVFAGLASLSSITVANLVIGGGTQTSTTRLTYSNATGILSYDADGLGGAQAVEVALIGVTTQASLTTAQFELVA
jgi:Ca2+-binding RTX toxin-like protein